MTDLHTKCRYPYEYVYTRHEDGNVIRYEVYVILYKVAWGYLNSGDMGYLIYYFIITTLHYYIAW